MWFYVSREALKAMNIIICLLLGHMFYYENSYAKIMQYSCKYAQKTDFAFCTVIG